MHTYPYALLLTVMVAAAVMACVIPVNVVAEDSVRYQFTVVIPVKLAGETKQKVGTATITKTNNIVHFSNVVGGKYQVVLKPAKATSRYVIVTYDKAPPSQWWKKSNVPNTLLNRVANSPTGNSVAYDITVPEGTHTLYVGVSTGSESWTVTLYKYISSSSSDNGVYNGQVTVHVVNDVVKVVVDVPKDVYIVRGSTANITLKVTQTQGYPRFFSAQVSLPSHDLQASVTAANHVAGHSNEWLGNGTVTVSLTVPLSASEGTQYVLNISIFASHDPADTYSTPPTPPPAVVYGSSNVGDEWKLCGRIGFSPLMNDGGKPQLTPSTMNAALPRRNIVVIAAAAVGLIVLAALIAVMRR